MKKSIRKKNKTNKKKLIIIPLILLAILALIYLVTRLDLKSYFVPIYKMSDRTENVKKAKAKYKNETEVVGWIKVQGTNIDYPIIYMEEGSYKEVDFDYAWINDNPKSLTNKPTIFGHNIRNVSSSPIIGDNTMRKFEQLMSYIYYDFNKENKYIQYTINGKNYLYQIFSVSLVSNFDIDYEYISYTKDEMKEYITKSLKESFFKYDIEVDENDKIITLVTCTRFDGKQLNDLKIDAKLIEKEEKGYNYKVSEKKNYKDIKKILKGDGEHV